MQVLTAPGGPVMTNTFVVADDAGTAVVIDLGYDPDALAQELAERGWTVAAMVATHGHFDHVCGFGRAKQLWPVPLYMHRDTVTMARTCAVHALAFGVKCHNSPAPDANLAQGDTLPVGDLTFEIRETSGHCPGSISLVLPGHAFVGDALFAGSIGRVDLPLADARLLMRNIREQLMTLPDDTVVYPGHGETTTIGEERRHNPFRAEWERPA